MKASPLRLNWIRYPEASYEALDTFDGEEGSPISADVDAQVRFVESGEHFVYLQVASKDEIHQAYRFSVTAVAAFAFDLDIARAEYKASSTANLVPMVVTNVARIVYSGIREFLAVLTARGPYGVAVLESVLLEPSDVQIKSEMTPVEVLRRLFRATDEEVSALEARVGAREAAEAQSEVKSAKKAKKQKGGIAG